MNRPVTKFGFPTSHNRLSHDMHYSR
jgi:hypothetical protein